MIDARSKHTHKRQHMEMSSSSPPSKSSSSLASPPAPVLFTPSSPSNAAQLGNAQGKPVTLQAWPTTAEETETTPRFTPSPPPHPALAPADESSKSKPPVVSDIPSAPITIPAPKTSFDPTGSYTPSTPLTARDRAGGFLPIYSRTPSRLQLGSPLAPRYIHCTHRGRYINSFSDDSSSPPSSAESNTSMHRERPSSPLSPSAPMPFSPLSTLRSQAGQSAIQSRSKPAPKLQLKSLPRFHPANYEASSASADATPRASRPSTAQSHIGRLSDAQAKLHQYQRDIVVNATRAASLTFSPKTTANPMSPRLNPVMGSPGPVTPLMLEDEDDYMSAHNTGSPDSRADRGRELVQRLVDQENEQRIYSRRSGSHSPAVSPAGGRG